MAYTGKDSFKKRVDICITDSLCYTPETNIVNQLYPNLKRKETRGVGKPL